MKALRENPLYPRKKEAGFVMVMTQIQPLAMPFSR